MRQLSSFTGSWTDRRHGWLVFLAPLLLPAVSPAQVEIVRLHPLDGVVGDRFGAAVDILGRTVVVGAPEHDEAGPNAGAVYVFEELAARPGNWRFVQEILPPPPLGSDKEFGSSVALHGSTLAVGWPYHDVVDGAVAVYERTGPARAPWEHVKTLTTRTWDKLGSQVALQKDTLVASSLTWCGCNTCIPTEAVYVFGRDVGGPDFWGEVQRIPSPQVSQDRFGTRIALQGSELFVGAPYDANFTASCLTGPGMAYLFERSFEGAWSLARSWSSPTPGARGFGQRIAVDGDLLAARAFGATTLVRIYDRNAGVPGAWQLLKTVDGTGNFFGEALLLHGTRLFVGEIPPGAEGRVHLFERHVGGENAFGQVATLQPMASSPGDAFGVELALDGRLLVVGSPKNSAPGAAYVFELSQPPRTRTSTEPATELESRFR